MGSTVLLSLCSNPDLWHALELQSPVMVQVLEREHTRPRRQPGGKVGRQQRPRDRRQRVIPVQRTAARRAENEEAIACGTKCAAWEARSTLRACQHARQHATGCSPIIHAAHLALPRRHSSCCSQRWLHRAEMHRRRPQQRCATPKACSRNVPPNVSNRTGLAPAACAAAGERKTEWSCVLCQCPIAVLLFVIRGIVLLGCTSPCAFCKEKDPG